MNFHVACGSDCKNILKNKRRLCENLCQSYELWSVGVGAGRTGQHFWSCFWAHGNIGLPSERHSVPLGTQIQAHQSCIAFHFTNLTTMCKPIFIVFSFGSSWQMTEDGVGRRFDEDVWNLFIQPLSLSLKTSSSSAHHDEQSNNCMDFSPSQPS